MFVAGTFGHADRLLLDEETAIWSTPVVVLGGTLLVSLLLEGADPTLAAEPSALPRVTLAAQGADGSWVACESLGRGGGGADSSMVVYATFRTPAAMPDELRLEVQHRGNVAVRMMPLIGA